MLNILGACRDIPVREQHHDIRALRLRNSAALIAVQPAERAAQRAAAAATDQQALVAHELAHGGEGLVVRGLDPLVDVGGVAREDVRDEVVADALDDVLLAGAVLVQGVREGEDAAFL